MMEATGSRSEECRHEHCSRAAESNGSCIFHISKPTAKEKQQMSPDERLAAEQIDETFRSSFFSLLEELAIDGQTDEYDFSNFSFPSISLKDTKYAKRVNFAGATFSEGASFLHATFKRASFHRATFSEGASFNRAAFSERADFLTPPSAERQTLPAPVSGERQISLLEQANLHSNTSVTSRS
jgi:hypothetical protein